MWSEEEIRRNVGQLFVVGFHGPTASPNILRLIHDHHVGGIVLFQRNVGTRAELLALTQTLQHTARAAGHAHPLSIGIDQEGGLVTRIKPPIAAQLPGAMTLAATGSLDATKRVAHAVAHTLAAYGINTNYAPVADVNSEPANPVIGVRSPGDDPEAVGRFASAAAQGLRDGGVVPCVKHFPGHGDTAVDSHYGLPVIAKGRAALDACETVPFRRAVAEEVESIMTAHIALPGLGGGDEEAGLPASLSPRALRLLREEMQYRGVVVTDCLEMDGVRATYGTERGAVMALQAGNDAVMICHTFEVQVRAMEMVCEAVRSGEIPFERIEEAVNRVRSLKEKTLDWERALKKPQVEQLEAMSESQIKLAEEVYGKSTTLVRAETGALPVSANEQIVFLSPGDEATKGGAVSSGEIKTRVPYTPSEFVDTLRTYSPSILDVRYYPDEQLPLEVTSAIESGATVILATRNARLATYQRQMGLELAATAKKLIVVATCDPYDFLDDHEVKTYITIYEPTLPAFQAAADVIFGKTAAQGTLPVGRVRKTPLIETFDLTRDIAGVAELWKAALPSYPITEQRLSRLLARENGNHFVIWEDEKLVAFCATYGSTNRGNAQGHVSVILVAPRLQGQGIGTALIVHAREFLRSKFGIQNVGVGSYFPRFWPGVPIDLPVKNPAWFEHRGYRLRSSSRFFDLYKGITDYSAPAGILERAEKEGYEFGPLRPDQAEECLVGQRRNFTYNTGWVEAYEALVANSQYSTILAVTHKPTNTQVGWTLMASADSPLTQGFACLPMAGEDVGLVCCVGIDKDWRGKGVGMAMLVAALLDLKGRGAKGVFIDWVVLGTFEGYYRKAGFDVWREYRYGSW